MPRGGSRGLALGLAAAMTLGASGGMLMSRVSAEASTVTLPIALPLPLTSPEQAARVLSLRAERPAPAAEPATPRPARAACGPRDGRLITWRVKVGSKIATSVDEFATGVQQVLCDERGWIGTGVRFRYDPRDAAFTVSLFSARNTERRCQNLIGLSVNHTWSCAGTTEAVLNADRWFGGSPRLDLSVRRYRQLLVNHEVGHLLGHRHARCPGAGKRAPVMMQQSFDLGGCRANGWPTAAELS